MTLIYQYYILESIIILYTFKHNIFGDNIRGFFENPAQRRILTTDYVDRVPYGELTQYYPILFKLGGLHPMVLQ